MIKTREHFVNLYKKRSFTRYLLSTLGYSLYAGACIGFVCMLPLLIIPAIISKRLKHLLFISTLNHFVYFLTRIYLPLVRTYKIIEEKYPPAPSDNSPVIYIANHRSQLDGPIIMARLKNTGVVMKSTYTNTPLFASFVKNADFISVNPSSLESLNIAIRRSKELLAKGKNLLIFPEGSRSRSSKLLPFKDLAFRLSIDTDTPVVPLVIHTDYPIMAKKIRHSFFPPEILQLTIRSYPAVKADPGERASEFADRIRQFMSKEIKLLDKNTYWEYL